MNKIRRFMCNVLGWHRPDKTIKVCGINRISKCKYCGREIMKDSQGNWFAEC
jgi:hypothetical protein